MPFNELFIQEEDGAAPVPPLQEFIHKRRSLLLLPLVVIPFLSFMFYSLGGGKGPAPDKQVVATGFNIELPAARLDKKKAGQNKLEVYKQADQDSIRRRELLRMDPFFQHIGDTVRASLALQEDKKTDALIENLERLSKTIRQPAAVPARPAMLQPVFQVPDRAHVIHKQEVDTIEADPEMDRLNGMLDKIIKIQHPEEGAPLPASFETPAIGDLAAMSLPAVVQEDQVLVAGATIALRMTEETRINGVHFPKDQLVYGVLSINNDRMLIAVNSIRREQSIYSTALQVYDLDGLPGIHIPGSLGRETAKESAEQGIHSMGLSTFDPSITGQAVNAGVLAARSLLSRKVRQVRVSIKAGYQVLLRNTKPMGQVLVGRKDSGTAKPDSIQAPEAGSFEAFLHKSVRKGKVELELEGVYLKDGLMWIILQLDNHSPIGYAIDYVHWSIRDRHQARRTAMQEVNLQPLFMTPMEPLAGNSSRGLLAAFKPFALPENKEVVLQLAEGNGARELGMHIKGKDLLKAKSYAQP